MQSFSFKADPELRELVEQNSEKMTKKAGGVLFKEGEKAVGIYLVISGSVKLMLHSAGIPVLVRVAVEGGLVGVPATINSKPYSLTAVVEEDSVLALLPANVVRELMKTRIDFALKIVTMLSQEVQAMRRVIADPRKGLQTSKATLELTKAQ